MTVRWADGVFHTPMQYNYMNSWQRSSGDLELGSISAVDTPFPSLAFPANTGGASDVLKCCLEVVWNWMSIKRLKSDLDKTGCFSPEIHNADAGLWTCFFCRSRYISLL